MTGAAQMLTVRVPLAARKLRGGRKPVLTPTTQMNRGHSAAGTTLLAPGILEAILDGRQPDGMKPPGLMKRHPKCWVDQ